jgi:ribosomal protein S18 acetylase RimI-like enzyme
MVSVAVCFCPPSAVRKAGFICEKRTFATTLWCSSVVYSEGLLSDEDLKSISRLLSDAFDSKWFPFKAISVMDFNAQLQDRRSRLVAAGKRHVMLVARGGEALEVVGFLEMGVLASSNAAVLEAVRVEAAEKTSTEPYNKASVTRFPTIGNLVIKDSFRRRGIARELMRRAHEVALSWGPQEFSHILVAVDPDNKGALELYRSMGYKVVDRGAPQTVVRDLRQRQMEFDILLQDLSLTQWR